MAVKHRAWERAETAQARAYLVLAERLEPVSTQTVSSTLAWNDTKSLKILSALYDRGLARRTKVEVKDRSGNRIVRRLEYRWEALL